MVYKTMIINISNSGNTGNKLLFNIHLLGTAIKTNQKIVNIFATNDIVKFGIGNKSNNHILICSQKLSNKRIIRVRNKLERIILKNDFNSYNLNFIEKRDQILRKITRPGIHILNNWYYRDYDAIKKYRKQISKIISPPEGDLSKAINHINILKENYSDIIGIHIRSGDYENWLGGKYYYTIDNYLKWMIDLDEDFKTRSKNPFFIIFSNDKIILQKTILLNFEINRGSVTEDLALMTKVDYLMGPPSTFTWYAHYVSDNKYCTLLDKTQKLQIESFSTEIPAEVTSYY